MKNTFGSSITITLFGESHGTAIGAVLDGLSPGIKIDMEYIEKKIDQRRPVGRISTQRKEADEVEFISGVYNGYTTGTPLAIIIKNENMRSGDYNSVSRLMRPSHADLTASFKYDGFEDYRGGGHFSGRITAAIVAAGAIMMKALEDKGIYIGSHLKRCAGVCDREFENYKDDIRSLDCNDFPMLDKSAAEKAISNIEAATQDGDSVGGIVETVIYGMKKGIGEPWFDTVESMLAHAIFAVPAVKGVEFGAGFAMTDMKGSEANDPIKCESGRYVTATNNNGGINGGITNGMPIIFRTAVKPTPSIFKPQETVDIISGSNAILELKGRHDPAIVHRARAVIDAITAITVADLLTCHFGTNYLMTEKNMPEEK